MTTSAEDLDVVPIAPSQSPDDLTFRITNTSPDRVHDVVKCYVDSTYLGYDYVDVDRSESEDVVYDLRKDIDADSRVVVTTSTREDGVLLDSSFDEVREMAVDAGEATEETESQSGDVDEEQSGPRPQQTADTGQLRPPEDTSAPAVEGDGTGQGEQPLLDESSEEEERTEPEPAGVEEEAVPEQSTRTVASGPAAVEEEERQSMPSRPVPTDKRPPQDDESGGVLSSIRSSFFHSGSADTAPEPEEVPSERDEDEPGEEQEEVQEKESLEEPDERRDAVQDEESGSLPSHQVGRMPTGIINLDEKMQGGFVDGTMNLVTGKTGTGKTAFSASFIKEGVDQDQRGVYVTTEERKEDIQADIEAMFGWDFSEYEDEGMVRVMSIKPIFPSKEIENLNRLVRSYITDLLNQVKQAIDDLDADRVVIDSVSIIEMFIRDEYMARVALSKLLNSLREENVTAVLTGGIPETSEGLSGGGIIEYLVDTVILLEFVPVAEEHKRTLTIRKMRRTDHDVDIFPLEITPRGMEIRAVEDSPL